MKKLLAAFALIALLGAGYVGSIVTAQHAVASDPDW
jgi:hypothetical protein